MADQITNGSGGGNWLDDATWANGAVPADTDRIIVAEDDTLVINGICKCKGGARSTSNAASNAAIEVRGKLTLDKAADTELHTEGQIYNQPTSAAYQCEVDFGNDAAPVTGSFKWFTNPEGSTVTGYVNALYNYFSGSRYPTFTMQGNVDRVVNTWLVNHYDAGVTEIEVADATNWQVGDGLWLVAFFDNATTSRNKYEAEIVEIQAINGNVITLTAATQYAHGYADAKDHKAAGVCNITSNVQVVAGDDRPQYRIYSRRGNIKIKNVACVNANNRFNYVNGCLTIHDGKIAGLIAHVENTVLIIDALNLNVHMHVVMFHYVPYDGVVNKNNAIVCKSVHSGRSIYGGFANYYNGRNIIFENCCVYGGGNRFVNVGFSCYQQPVTYNQCRAYNCDTGFYLHDNVDTDTVDCWAVACKYVGTTYNGTAIFKDMHIRWCNYLAQMLAQWRGKATWFRPDYTDDQLGHSISSAVEYGDPLPDGNEIKLIDYQNNTNNQHWYYSGGQKWWEYDPKRNDPHSIGMRSDHDTYTVPHEIIFKAETGDTLLCSAYVKNISDGYHGTLRMMIMQGSTVIVTKDIDLEQIDIDVWTLLSISGTAVKTMDTILKFEYFAGDGEELALTDFRTPFSQSINDIAQAVWAQKVEENQNPGSFGFGFKQCNAWLSWLRRLL